MRTQSAFVSTSYVMFHFISTTYAQSEATFTSCSNNMVEFVNPIGNKDSCEQLQYGQNASYPTDFNVLNAVAHFVCPVSDVRIIISNGIPNHFIEQENPNLTCEVDWFVQVPLHPIFTSNITEPSDDGIIAMTLNGVPGYGAQEDGSYNAMSDDPSNPASDAKNWWGHADEDNQQHYHNPKLGRPHEVPARTLKGYALDGFPIYGPVRDASKLDKCNGMVGPDGKYRYHTRTTSQVNASASYCDGSNPWTNWNYILGCYHGDMSRTVVASYKQETIPSDCVLVEKLSNNVNLLNLTFSGQAEGSKKGNKKSNDANSSTNGNWKKMKIHIPRKNNTEFDDSSSRQDVDGKQGRLLKSASTQNDINSPSGEQRTNTTRGHQEWRNMKIRIPRNHKNGTAHSHVEMHPSNTNATRGHQDWRKMKIHIARHNNTVAEKQDGMSTKTDTDRFLVEDKPNDYNRRNQTSGHQERKKMKIRIPRRNQTEVDESNNGGHHVPFKTEAGGPSKNNTTEGGLIVGKQAEGRKRSLKDKVKISIPK